MAEKNSNPKDDDHEVNDVNSSNLPACYTLVTSGIPARHVCSSIHYPHDIYQVINSALRSLPLHLLCNITIAHSLSRFLVVAFVTGVRQRS